MTTHGTLGRRSKCQHTDSRDRRSEALGAREGSHGYSAPAPTPSRRRRRRRRHRRPSSRPRYAAGHLRRCPQQRRPEEGAAVYAADGHWAEPPPRPSRVARPPGSASRVDVPASRRSRRRPRLCGASTVRGARARPGGGRWARCAPPQASTALFARPNAVAPLSCLTSVAEQRGCWAETEPCLLMGTRRSGVSGEHGRVGGAAEQGLWVC